MTERLYRLASIVKALAAHTAMDWLGVYALYDHYHIDGYLLTSSHIAISYPLPSLMFIHCPLVDNCMWIVTSDIQR
jgi:hypothetical protein